MEHKNWIFTKEQLANTPSSKSKGLEIKNEELYRREGIHYIMNIGQELKLIHNPTLATACVFFHRFYMFYSFEEFSRYEISLACLLLAGKVEETPKKCKDIIATAKSVYPKHSPTDPIKLVYHEMLLIQALNFDLRVVHPYDFLMEYSRELDKVNKNLMTQVVQSAWTFVNDSFFTTLCLIWEPEFIAIAMLHMAFKKEAVNESELEWKDNNGEKLHWWDHFTMGLDVEMVEEICHKLMDVYQIKANGGG